MSLHGPVQFPAMVEYFKRFFMASHTLPTCSEPAMPKMAQSLLNGTNKTWGYRGRPKFNLIQTTAEKYDGERRMDS